MINFTIQVNLVRIVEIPMARGPRFFDGKTKIKMIERKPLKIEQSSRDALVSIVRRELNLDFLNSEGMLSEEEYEREIKKVLLQRDLLIVIFAGEIKTKGEERFSGLADGAIEMMSHAGELSDNFATFFLKATGIMPNASRNN